MEANADTKTIDLRFSEIKWWEFWDDKVLRATTPNYLKTPAGDPHKQRHTFSSIEQNLFNRGPRRRGGRGHKAMRQWCGREHPQVWPLPKESRGPLGTC